MAARNSFKGLSTAVRELRFHLCQKSQSSKGTRDFIEKFYVNVKTQNPKLPILIRECSGIEPRLYARFDFGQEKSVPLSDLGSEQVVQTLQKLIESGPK